MDENINDEHLKPQVDSVPKKKRKRRKFEDGSRYYIDKTEYNGQLEEYSKTKECSDRLGELFMLHVQRCASAANFKGYTYRSEMESTALFFLLKYSVGFDASGSKSKDNKANAFAYCTQIIHNAFLQVIAKEKKHSKLKDLLIKNQPQINHQAIKFSILDKIDD